MEAPGLIPLLMEAIEQTGHGAAFEVDHYMAGLGATMTAAASLLGALAALGITRKKATAKANEGTEESLVEAYERGVEKGAQLARQNA